MQSGSVTLNGGNDEALSIVFKFKSEHEGKFVFNPQAMQATSGPANPGKVVYNGLTLSWSTPDGLKLVIELLQKLEHHHSGQKAG